MGRFWHSKGDDVESFCRSTSNKFLLKHEGWRVFGVYGGTIATPRIDRLAREGMRFNNYDVEEWTCSLHEA